MLNRDTWKAEALLPFLLENFVFWQSDFEQPRALNYCRLYRLPLGSPPHIGLVDPRTKQSMKTWTGFVAPEQMLEDLSAFIAENPMTRFETLDPVATASSSSALPDDVISATMTDDERLAKAIQESLAASAPVAAEDAKHASSTEESSDNAATSDEEEESQVVEEEAKTGETVSVEVPAEPEAGPDVVNIQIVFQNGNKVRRRVHTTLLLSELYELTLLLAQAQGCAEGTTIEAFDLVCSWPKRVLPRVKDCTVQDENLKNSALRVLWL
jgi:hypothetical protein